MSRPPLGIRILSALRSEPDWSTMSAERLAAFAAAENRKRSARLTRLVSGFPDRGATIAWQRLDLPGRAVPVRVHRPAGHDAPLPLVLHIHGGGFVGTATQSDWINSHLAAHLPAVVVSVEHRLIAPSVPLAAAVDDGWDVLRLVLEHAGQWRIDPSRATVFGESAGGAVAALCALRARDAGLRLRAQVLVNPAVDLTATALDYASVREHPDSPTLTVATVRFFRELAVPEGTDPRPLSPLYADSLRDLAPALVVVPTLDPLADQGRRYAERLRAAGTPAELTEHPGAVHAFVSMPGVVPQAKAARDEITGFLRARLAA
ncbi:alpha/beta hydrolase [Dactylosporangium salmoneum]|uniref:Alpha/beta hydrolase n=1 Tax=Dactylosporangium salmoneum TaxID=53361 RepID=A0ABP5U8B6_9ACTN